MVSFLDQSYLEQINYGLGYLYHLFNFATISVHDSIIVSEHRVE